MRHTSTSPFPTHHLLWTFGVAGPVVGFIATVVAVTSLIPTPEGVTALVYGLHPLGLALIYAAGLAPALATASVLILIQDRGYRLCMLNTAGTGFIISLAYGLIAATTAFLPKPEFIALGLAGIGAFSAIVCLLITSHLSKILAPSASAG